jgi:hypothetical protein
MSVSTMTRLLQTRQADDEEAVHQHLEQTMGSDAAPDKGTETAEKDKLTALEKLHAFVPTEVITAWAAAVGLVVPETDLGRWLIFIAAVIVLILLHVLNALFLRGQALASPKPQASSSTISLLGLILLSTVAFTVWAFAAPGSPAVMWGDSATRYFAVAALFVTPVLYRAAQLWGLAPLDQKQS